MGIVENQEIRILHIDTGIAWRGGQRQSLSLHQGLLKKNIKSFLVSNIDGKQIDIAKKDNIPNIFGFHFYSEISLVSIREISEIYNRVSPHIVHCHDSHSLGLFRKLNRSCIVFHTRRVSYPINFLSRFLKYNKADYHVCVSDEINRYMSQFFKNVFTIHSCIDELRFKEERIKSPFRTNPNKRFLYVGAFSEQKGIDILIKGFSYLLKEFTNIELNLVGDGPLLEDMKFLVNKLGINKSVYFHGSKNNVEGYYLFSDIVISPSVDGEGSNGVIKEAMICKKIIIASDIRSNMELIDDKVNGFLFKNKDISSLEKLIKQILLNELSLKKNSIYRRATDFLCEKLVDQYLYLYSKSLRKNE